MDFETLTTSAGQRKERAREMVVGTVAAEHIFKCQVCSTVRPISTTVFTNHLEGVTFCEDCRANLEPEDFIDMASGELDPRVVIDYLKNPMGYTDKVLHIKDHVARKGQRNTVK